MQIRSTVLIIEHPSRAAKPKMQRAEGAGESRVSICCKIVSRIICPKTLYRMIPSNLFAPGVLNEFLNPGFMANNEASADIVVVLCPVAV